MVPTFAEGLFIPLAVTLLLTTTHPAIESPSGSAISRALVARFTE
jgi:hypothetical protein